MQPLLEVPQSAALFGVQWILFWLAGSGDAIARFAPACAGAGVVLLPWILRRSLGRAESLSLAALLAFDPLLIGYSRLADGAAITAAAAWTMILCGIALARVPDWSRGSACTAAAAIAAGIFIVSGRLAWELLPPMALFLIFLRHSIPRHRILLAGVTALVLTTSAFMQLQGPQFVSSSLTQFVLDWVVSGGLTPHAWTAFSRFELLPLVVGSVGIALGFSSGPVGSHPNAAAATASRSFFVVLLLWTLWGALLTARPGGSPTTWLVLQPPLFLGAGYLVSRCADVVHARAGWPSGWTRRWLPRLALPVVTFLVLHFAGGGIKVAQDQQGAYFQPYPDSTSRSVRRLSDDIGALMRGESARLDIVVPLGADPVLGWIFRSEPNVHWVAAAAHPSSSRSRYTLVPGSIAAPADGGIGVYRLRRHGSVHELVTLHRNEGAR